MFIKNLTTIAQDTVLEGAMPAKEVAERIGKPYSTLLRELNPFDDHAKLGAQTLLDIMRITRNAKALEYMAKELGLRVVAADSAERSAMLFSGKEESAEASV